MKTCKKKLTAGSVISSRSPAWIMVRTSASIPPTWHTTVLLRWLLQVKLDKIPAAHVMTLTSLDPNNWTSPCSRVSRPSCYKISFTTQSSKRLRSGQCICLDKVTTNLFSSSVGKIATSPQTVLDQAMTLVPQVHSQSLHTSSFNNSWFVARANG